MYSRDVTVEKEQISRIVLELKILLGHMENRSKKLITVSEKKVYADTTKVVLYDRGVEDVIAFILAASKTPSSAKAEDGSGGFTLLHPMIAAPLRDIAVFFASVIHGEEEKLGFESRTVIDISCSNIEDQIARIEERGYRGAGEIEEEYLKNHDESTAFVNTLFKEPIYSIDSSGKDKKEVFERTLEHILDVVAKFKAVKD